PRAGGAPAHARVGCHAGRRPGLHARLLVAGNLSRARPDDHDALHQPVHQRPSGRAGPATPATVAGRDAMARIVRCGLVQMGSDLPMDGAVEEIKAALPEKSVRLIETAAAP